MLFFEYGPGVHLNAQDNEPIYQIIQLDSIVITAKRFGFDVNDFIDLVIRDTSFYEAFHNLRTAAYAFQNKISFTDNKQKSLASYRSQAQQFYRPPCRYMVEEKKIVTGNFFDKKGQYNYYTARLYDRMFFTHDTICLTPSSGNSSEDKNPKGMERHVNELKKLIFTPGRKANVPMIGNKTAIFEKDMLPYYTYSIKSDTIAGQPSYLFSVEVKPEYKAQQSGKTIIKNLHTWFAKNTFQILKRTYSLEAKTMLYQFKVQMDIDVVRVKTKYYPQHIKYEGRWKVASKKAEQASFDILFSDFKN